MPDAISIFSSRAIVLHRDDVDTDQIIPARFLTTTERRGLGRFLFADWRSSGDGGAPFPREDSAGAGILVAGRNFGCGSSREHAPWALADFGFRAVVARSFADIFRSNALKNGLVPIALDDPAHRALHNLLAHDASAPLTVDVDAMTLAGGGMSWPFALPPFARRCLLDGVDELGYLLAAGDELTAYERAHA